MFRLTRCLRSSYKIYLSEEACFVVQHPDTQHPYEHTKPLPKYDETTLNQTANQSYLKETSKNMFTKSPNLEQLQCLTYTPERYWHQYPGRVKRMKYKASYDDNVDRPGLTS